MLKRCVAYMAGLFLGLALVPISATDVWANEKQDDIVALIRATGTMEVVDQMIERQVPRLLEEIRGLGIDTSQMFYDRFETMAAQEFRNSKPQLVRAIIAIYDNNFSHQEILELSAFYQSSTGRKVITMAPQMVQQSLALGKVWGAEISQKVIDRLQAELAENQYEY